MSEAIIEKLSITWTGATLSENRVIHSYNIGQPVGLEEKIEGSHLLDQHILKVPVQDFEAHLKEAPSGRYSLTVMNSGQAMAENNKIVFFQERSPLDGLISPIEAVNFFIFFGQHYLDAHVAFQESLQRGGAPADDYTEKTSQEVLRIKQEFMDKTMAGEKLTSVTGEAVLEECLSGKIDADSQFYKKLWEGMQDVFIPAAIYAATLPVIRAVVAVGDQPSEELN